MTVWNLLWVWCLLLILLVLHKCRRRRAFVPHTPVLVPRPPVFPRSSGFYPAQSFNLKGSVFISLLSKLPSPKKATKPSKNHLKKTKKRARKAHNRAHVNPNTDSITPKSSSHVNPPIDNINPKSMGNTNSKTIVQRAGCFRPELHGMDKYEIELMEFLEHGTASLIGIFGMRGVGKTTLLKLMRTYYSQLSSFRYIFYVEAGKDFRIDLLSGVVSRDIGFGTTQVVNQISSFLRDQSFLLLLDDLQCVVDLADGGIPIKLGPRQKIVFTTRDATVLAEMGCAENSFRMNCLDEVTAWNLFKYLVGDEILNSHLDIKELAKKMVAECHGIPGALRTLGGFMSTKKSLEVWVVVHDMLIKNRSFCEIEETENEGYSFLQFLRDEI